MVAPRKGIRAVMKKDRNDKKGEERKMKAENLNK